jgi:hypothetical protein
MSCRLLANLLLVQFLVSSLVAANPATATGTRAALLFDVGGDEELARQLRGPISTTLREKARVDIAPGKLSRPEHVDMELTCRVSRSGYRIDAAIVDARKRSSTSLMSSVAAWLMPLARLRTVPSQCWISPTMPEMTAAL